MQYVLVQNNIIINIIVIDKNAYTTTFGQNADGSRFPTVITNGIAVPDPSKFIIPDGQSIFEYTGGGIGDAYPYIAPPPTAASLSNVLM